MQLVRLALVSLSPWPDDMSGKHATFGDVEIDADLARDEAGNMLLLVKAHVSLAVLPDRDAEGVVSVPLSERHNAEAAIETFANLLSVSLVCKRQISSPGVCAYLVPESDADRQWLTDSAGLQSDHAGFPRLPTGIMLDDPTLQALNDRSDGVALLAEALSHDHATGRFHELIRVYERAFAVGPYHLIDPLSAFLETGLFGYAKDEVLDWIERRQPATHADRRPEFMLEADIAPVIARMEQAAYDVVLNKDLWRDKSPARRVVWDPEGGTSDRAGSMFVRKGSKPRMEFKLLDAFSAYPLHLAAAGVPNTPTDWWPREADESAQPDVVAPHDDHR